jgi:phosphoribosylanthranilate isomerase
MFIKICGMTRLEDARSAVAHGASAIGFVFWPRSPRFVAPEAARTILRRLPEHVRAVGVFVNQQAADINATAELVGLSAVQLHGDEQPSFLRVIERPVIKAIDLSNGAADEWPDEVTMLVDARDPERRGGTGQLADWQRAAQLAKKRRVVLAGGLTAENVTAAIGAVHPFGVDVSSGIEAEPGIKDPARLSAFFAAIERAERESGESR